MTRSTLFGVRLPVWLIRTTVSSIGGRVDGYKLTRSAHV